MFHERLSVKFLSVHKPQLFMDFTRLRKNWIKWTFEWSFAVTLNHTAHYHPRRFTAGTMREQIFGFNFIHSIQYGKCSITCHHRDPVSLCIHGQPARTILWGRSTQNIFSSDSADWCNNSYLCEPNWVTVNESQKIFSLSFESIFRLCRTMCNWAEVVWSVPYIPPRPGHHWSSGCNKIIHWKVLLSWRKTHVRWYNGTHHAHCTQRTAYQASTIIAHNWLYFIRWSIGEHVHPTLVTLNRVRFPAWIPCSIYSLDQCVALVMQRVLESANGEVLTASLCFKRDAYYVDGRLDYIM